MMNDVPRARNRAHRRDQTLANPPQRRLAPGVEREVRVRGEGETRKRLVTGTAVLLELALGSALVLDQKGRRALGQIADPGCVTPGWSSIDRSDARSISSRARAPVSRSGAMAAHARGTSPKKSKTGVLDRVVGNGAEHRLGDKPEGALGPDHEVAQERRRVSRNRRTR